jgi:hypothetical protein
VFDWHDARLRDHPDFAMAHAQWEERFRSQGFRGFDDVALPLKRSLPPDADRQAVEHRYHDAVRIRFGDDTPIYTGQGFLNINAEDFGIEFDRIAKLSVGPEAVFCDGELRSGLLLNRVVGLFAVDRVHELLAQEARRFLPDRFFWNGEDRTGDELTAVIESYLRTRGSSWANLEQSLRKHAAPQAPRDPFDLCPVTRTIIGRHRQLRAVEDAGRPSPAIGDPFDVFLSFASEDHVLARKVYDELAATTAHRVFFSDVSVTAGGFADQIDRALDAAWAFVAIGTRVEHLHKSWVKYEWRNFHNDMMSGRKHENSPFLAFVAGIEPQELPRPFFVQQAVTADPVDPTSALTRLKHCLAKP